jgi:hypothetical protein
MLPVRGRDSDQERLYRPVAGKRPFDGAIDPYA